MGTIAKRIAKLETTVSATSEHVHVIRYDEGETDEGTAANREAALAAYGPEKIGANDRVLNVVFVAPAQSLRNAA